MRRLNHRRDERGASAVIVAIMLVVLVGFGALAVDVGSLWWDKKQIQNGADAAALALAQTCAAGACEADEPAMAQDYAAFNKNDDNVTVTAADITHTPNSVSVKAATTREHWLAPVIGIGSSDVSAQATATWSGAPSSMNTIPFAVSYCQFFWQNGVYNGTPTKGTELYIYSKSKPKDFPNVPSTEAFPCAASNSAHNELSGGFGFLEADGDCVTKVTIGSNPDERWVDSSNGEGFDTSCDPDDIRRYMGDSPGQIVKVPLFDNADKNSGRYRITGFAALEVTAYCLQTQGWASVPSDACATDPVNGKNAYIKGKFVGFGSLADWENGSGAGVDFGVVNVRLTG
ncbi:pilus assembly protein TadG-related protein [Tessaracoccus sp. MC1756]|uniref:pilus assembly protein TadG-related protein n=1 Tax=Tessaracoccus sp. MC1756 TaxID=2760311 RepID=UPI0015FF1134|nr:pilus assembly protein TadG-related protein [Tessaracoccus sp. MC1756]MBB1509471.1 hypothetical protein [Tessaracoccus sp. MC1756]